MLEGKDVLVCYGLEPLAYEKVRSWLEADAKRRLVFVEEDRERVWSGEGRQVRVVYIDSPLEVEKCAREIAERAVFLGVALWQERQSEWFALFQDRLEEWHRRANLLLSDGAEWGVPLARNARKNLKKPFKQALDLSFKDIPAVIVGAGPSLLENRHLLEEVSKGALLLAGGNALRSIPVAPHFGGVIDGQGKVESRFRKMPVCFQARVERGTLKNFEGERLLAPDSHFSFLNWIAGVEGPFDGGWTVGNFLTRLAVEWGCNPIIFVGMDGCKKKGKEVETQADWLQAKRWTEQLARRHPERHWINATEGGLGFEGIEEKKLAELKFKPLDLRERVTSAVEELAVMKGRWEEWEESLRAGGEIVQEQLLKPLWKLWRPVFERELECDPYEGKMEMNRKLFFEQVIQEHLQ